MGQDLATASDRERVTELFRAMLPYYLHERAHDWRFLDQQRRVCEDIGDPTHKLQFSGG